MDTLFAGGCAGSTITLFCSGSKTIRAFFSLEPKMASVLLKGDLGEESDEFLIRLGVLPASVFVALVRDCLSESCFSASSSSGSNVGS